LVSSSFHESIDTALAELAQALRHQPDGDGEMIDFPDELLARSPLVHVDYVETRMLANSQSLPSYAPADELCEPLRLKSASNTPITKTFILFSVLVLS
jgi:hypothetical protein